MDRIRCDCAVGFIFDNIDYRVLLENTIEKDCGHSFSNQSVSLCWVSGGIVGGHTEKELNYKKVQLKLLKLPR